MNKRMTKGGFKAYLKRTRAQATCGSIGGCVLANYLHTDLGYVTPFVCSGYMDVSRRELKRPLPQWAKDVINTFDSLGDKSEGLGSVKTLRAAQYRKPLLAALT